MVVRSLVSVELVLGLLGQVGAVDEEKHAPRATKLDQSVERRDGEDRLPGSRGHLHERALPSVAKRALESCDRLDLIRI